MQHAFILMLDVGSDTDFQGVADDAASDLTAAGHDVVYVHPWTTPGTISSPLAAPIPPTIPNAPLHIPVPQPTIPFT